MDLNRALQIFGLHEERADEPRREGPKTVPTWDAEMQELIRWFLSTDMPSQPFVLDRGLYVIRPGRFFEMIKTDISAGPDGPRWRTGALRKDLERLLHKWQSEQVGNGSVGDSGGS